MICSLGETWISEMLMAPWTEKNHGLKWKERLRSDIQTHWTCTEQLIRCTKSRECLWKTSPHASLPAIPQIGVLVSESGADISIWTRGMHYYDAATFLLSSVASWPCLAQRNLARLICGIKYCPSQLNAQDKAHVFAPAGNFETLGELLEKKDDIIKLSCLITEFLRQSKQRVVGAGGRDN